MIRCQPKPRKARADYLPAPGPCQQFSPRIHLVKPSSRKITFSPFLPSSSLAWATGFAVLLVALQFLPPDWHRALWFDRAAIDHGQWWRLLTGNLVHLGWRHLALNVSALLIGIWVFYPARTPIAWAIALVVCGVVSSLGLYFFSPEVMWCVGMSGALHGLLMIGAIDWIRQGDRMGWLLLFAWTGKLAWEQTHGAMPFSAETLSAPVVVDAHLWGAIGGLLYVALEHLYRRWRTVP
ncbi:MAG: rhombosortase [Gammaproteobacteria bacterium PRO9]|nr:rhombosortase [Gammaproteobacteria bacterium PRO9]